MDWVHVSYKFCIIFHHFLTDFDAFTYFVQQGFATHSLLLYNSPNIQVFFTKWQVLQLFHQFMIGQQKCEKLSECNSKQQLARNTQNSDANDFKQSQFEGKYKKFFQNLDLPAREEIQDQLTKSQKIYKRQSFEADIFLSIIDTDYQSVAIELRYGYYATKIMVIFLMMDYDLSEEIVIGQGQFGTVYLHNSKGVNNVIKSIQFTHQEQSILNEIKKISKQYFLTLIASELQTGPKVLDTLGYDIIAFKNVCLFTMEYCQKFGPFYSQRQSRQQIKKQLARSIHNLHCLNIVHCDVKPNNICWSPFHKKYVFIDFGLSRLLKGKINQKTLTSFVGTYAYSGQQMKKIYILKHSRYVDLYYNDIYGLVTTLNQMKLQITGDNSNGLKRQFQYPKQMLFEKFIELITVKKLIFCNKFQEAFDRIEKVQNFKRGFIQVINKAIQDEKVPIKHLQKWRKLKQSIYQQNFKACKIIEHEELLNNYFYSLEDMNKIFLLIPISQFLSKKKESDLVALFNSREWIQRIFIILNPLTNYLNINLNQRVKNNLYYIMKKMYEVTTGRKKSLQIIQFRAIFIFFFEKVKQWKNLQFLENLHTIFSFMKDYNTIQKIREEILNNLPNELLYGLKNLYYYLCSQSYSFFLIPIQNKKYLERIIKCVRQSKQAKQELRLLKEISQNFQSMAELVEYDCNAINFLFTNISNLMSDLIKIIHQHEHKQVLKQINHRYINLFKLFVVKLKEQDLKIGETEQENYDQILSQLQSRASHFSINQEKILKTADNLFNFIKNGEIYLRYSLQSTQDNSLFELICQYSFSTKRGILDFDIQTLNSFFYKIVSDNKKAVIFLNAMLNSVRQSVFKSFTCFYLVFKFIFQFKVCFLPSDCVEQQPEIDSLNNKNKIDQLITEILQQINEKSRQLNKFSVPQLKFAEFLNKIINKIQQYRQLDAKNLIQLLNLDCKEILSNQFNGHQLVTYNDSFRFSYLLVLTKIRKYKNKINAINDPKLDQVVFNYWENFRKLRPAIQFPFQYLCMKNTVSQLVQFYTQMLQYQSAFQILLSLIKSRRILIFHKVDIIRPKNNLLSIIFSYCNVTPVSQLQNLFNSMLKMGHLFTQKMNQDYYYSFLLLLLSRCHGKIQPCIIMHTLKKLAKSLKQMVRQIKKTSQPLFYNMHYKYAATNRMKKIQVKRSECRLKNIYQNKNQWFKLIRIIGRSAQNWSKDVIFHRLKDKIQRIYKIQFSVQGTQFRQQDSRPSQQAVQNLQQKAEMQFYQLQNLY